MKIEIKPVSIQDVVQYSAHLKACQGYKDLGEDGVFGMAGRLNIRPPYQREFIYKDVKRDSVIKTVRKDFPLNLVHWAINKDGSYEVLDGQQRIISIGQYVSNNFSFNFQNFNNLTEDQQAQILNYKLLVSFCEGTESEKLDWFRTINIAGEPLTEQELRNAIYTGPWLSNAKRYFSKSGCPAHQIADRYLKGTAIRQDYLETVLKWISGNNIEEYMATNQNNPNAEELWNYFESAITWWSDLFPKYRKEMKGLPIGELFNGLHKNKYDAEELEKVVSSLMLDDDVTKKSGIYTFILTGDEKYLSIRSFEERHKRSTYEKQNGICAHCGEHFEIEEMEADHITPWSKGGKTLPENCQMLCLKCNRTKSSK